MSQGKVKDIDLAILISQSGETLDTLAALSLLKKNHIPTLSIVKSAHRRLSMSRLICRTRLHQGFGGAKQ